MRRARRNSFVSLIALIAVAAHPARPSKEDAARHEIEQAERARASEKAAQQNAASRAAAAAAETERLAAERVAAAARLRQAEDETAGVAARIDALAAKQRQAEAALAARGETMQPLLPLIERLSLFPAETLLAVPARAEDTLRGVLVLRGLAAQLGQEAVALKRDQAALAAATHALEAETPRLAAALAAQKTEADALDRRIASAEAGRRQAEGEASAAAQRAAGEAARAETLRGVLTELESQRRAELAQAQEDAARAERQKRTDDAAAARQRQADLARPAGTAFAGGSQPHGRAHRTGRRQHHSSMGHCNRSGTGDGDFLPGAAGGTGRCGVHRPGRLCRAVPQLRETVDRRLRRRLPCGARRLRSARREGRTDRSGRRAGWRDAGLGTRCRGQPSRAVRRAAARWTAGEPGTVAESRQLNSHTRKDLLLDGEATRARKDNLGQSHAPTPALEG